jgi:FkbM family methyltransferase
MSIFPIESITKQFGVEIRGVIQVGAHTGGEVPDLLKCGVERIHLIEANADLIPDLQALAAGTDAHITISNVAISSSNGLQDFFITSFSQSSSLLKLADHKIVYPKIKEVNSVKVRTETLDDNILESGLDENLYNALLIDVQGAELDVLKGAKRALNTIDIIVCEVNYAELYRGCAQVEDLDAYLFDAGFVRVATKTPFHYSWGDAIYVKSSFVTDLTFLAQPKRHRVSMPTIGKNGRLANQLFQYLFLVLYGLRSGTEVFVPEFEAAQFIDFPLKNKLCPMLPLLHVRCSADAGLLLEALHPPRDVEFWGYFQHVSSAHIRHRALVQKLLAPKRNIKAALDAWWAKVREKYDHVTGLHIRRTDYKAYSGGQWEMFSQVPAEWYADFLRKRGAPRQRQAIFISTDDPGVRSCFADFEILQDTIPLPAEIDVRAGELFGLSYCDEALYCNSSWSFVAALLASDTQAARIVNFEHQTFVPFKPWEEQDFWAPFEPSRQIGKVPFRQCSPAQQEQRLLDHWRTQAELAVRMRKPLKHAIKRILNQAACAKLSKHIVKLLAPKKYRVALFNQVSRSERRWRLARALTARRQGSTCEEISSASR